MVTRLTVATIVQSVQISNHYAVHPKLMLYVNYTSIKAKTKNNVRILSYRHANTIQYRQFCCELSIYFMWVFIDTASW